jgi:hypothetical protein
MTSLSIPQKKHIPRDEGKSFARRILALLARGLGWLLLALVLLAFLFYFAIGGLRDQRAKWLARAEATEVEEKSFVIRPGRYKIDIRNDVGDVFIETSTNIQGGIEITRWAKALNQTNAEETLQALEVEINQEGSKIAIHANRSDPPTFFSSVADYGVDIKLKVPQTSDITIHNGRGHIKVEQVGGLLDVWNGVGDVEMMGVLSTNAQLTTGRGNVVYAGKVFAGGKYSLDTGLGVVGLALPPDSNFKIMASAGVGMIRNDFPLATGHQFWRGFNHKLSGQIGLEEDINLRLRADLGMVALQQRDVFDNDHEDKE